MRFDTTYIYDGHTGRLVLVGDRTDVRIDFSPDGFAVVNDHRGQQYRLRYPVVVEETTFAGNGGYKIVTAHWFGHDEWRTSRHLDDADSASRHMATAGFALRFRPDFGEHRVLTPGSGTEWYPSRGVIIAASLVTKW